MDKRTIRRLLTQGTIVPAKDTTPQQGICRTMLSRAELDGLSIPIIYKYYGDSQATETEGKRELAARWVAERFPYVELPPATLRVLPKARNFGDVGLGGVQLFVKGTVMGKDTNAWKDNGSGYDGFAAAVFDMLVAHADRHNANWLWRHNPKRGQRHLVLIDHGLCFESWNAERYPLPTCIGEYGYEHKGKRFPERWLRALRRIAQEASTGLLPYIDQEYAEWTAQRAAALAEVGYLYTSNNAYRHY